MFNKRLTDEKIVSINIALESTQLDSSSFVLLATALLEKILGSQFKDIDKPAILEKFLHNEVDESINTIKKVCEQYAEHKGLNESKLAPLLSEKKFVANDDPLKNSSRRLFESSFSLKLWDSLNETQFKSLEKLATVIKTMNPECKLSEDITSLQDVEAFMVAMREFGEKQEEVVAVHNSMRKNSIISNQKDRGDKREKTLSCNPGILKSYDPCLYHLVKEKAEEGRIVDMFNIDEKKEHGFSFTHKQIPFVNSVSGTVFTLVSILSFYMQANKESAELEKDVNNILKSFLAFACKNGYHSLAEMFYVLKSPEVVEKLNKFNVKFSFDFSQQIANEAYHDGIAYVTKTSLQNLIHQQIKKTIG